MYTQLQHTTKKRRPLTTNTSSFGNEMNEQTTSKTVDITDFHTPSIYPRAMRVPINKRQHPCFPCRFTTTQQETPESHHPTHHIPQNFQRMVQYTSPLLRCTTNVKPREHVRHKSGYSHAAQAATTKSPQSQGGYLPAHNGRSLRQQYNIDHVPRASTSLTS